MKKFPATAAVVLASATLGRAEFVIHELGSSAAQTYASLGNRFVLGCSLLAAGLVAAAFLMRKKGQ